MILRSVPWTRQPQGAVGINLANPLTLGLSFVSVPGVSVIGMPATPVLVGGASRNASDKGVAWSTSSAGGRLDYAGVMKAPSEATYATLFFNLNSTANQQYLVIKDAVSAAAFNLISILAPTSVQLIWGGYSALTHVCTVPSTEKRWAFMSASTPRAGQTTGATLWMDGVRPTPSYSGTGSNSFIGDDVVLCGRTTDNNRNFGGLSALSLIWSRVLSDAEHAALHANPWQLFAPQKRIIPYGAAASGLPTLSAPQMTGITTTGGYPQVAYNY